MRWVLALGFLALIGAGPVFAQQSGRGFRSFQGGQFQFRMSNPTRDAINALSSTAVQQLPVPVYGVALSSLTRNFGDARDGGTRTHEGLDIMAPLGSPIASPTDAVVTRVGNGANSGLYVRTANPGSETFVYMHLSKVGEGITEGKVLKRGDVIGFVGNTGNASGGPTHLHFEIRAGRTATDPLPRLANVFSADENARILAEAGRQGVVVAAANTVHPGAILESGMSGAQVTQLQQFLIEKNNGSAAAALASAGATGYFGALTEAALREYQRAASLSATGFVDSATYELALAPTQSESSDEVFDDDMSGAPASSAPAPASTPALAYAFTRDLEQGAEGEDVRALQVFLNTRGFTVAASGVGSRGSETTYFGPATKAALIRFQQALGIAPAAGYFGPKTRAVIVLL